LSALWQDVYRPARTLAGRNAPARATAFWMPDIWLFIYSGAMGSSA
jgi:hypothetical protein